jgi:hypothetical protein
MTEEEKAVFDVVAALAASIRSLKNDNIPDDVLMLLVGGDDEREIPVGALVRVISVVAKALMQL